MMEFTVFIWSKVSSDLNLTNGTASLVSIVLWLALVVVVVLLVTRAVRLKRASEVASSIAVPVLFPLSGLRVFVEP